MTPIPGNNATVRPFAGGPTVTNEQTSPDQTGTFEPNMNELANAARSKMHHPVPMGGLRSEQVVEAVIANYREQQHRAGVVEVLRDDLAIALMWATEGREDEGTPQDEGMKRLSDAYYAAA